MFAQSKPFCRLVLHPRPCCPFGNFTPCRSVLMSNRGSGIERDTVQALNDLRRAPALEKGGKRVSREQHRASFQPPTLGPSADLGQPQGTRETRSKVRQAPAQQPEEADPITLQLPGTGLQAADVQGSSPFLVEVCSFCAVLLLSCSTCYPWFRKLGP